MGDEGNASKKLTAKFLMVDYSTLSKDYSPSFSP